MFNKKSLSFSLCLGVILSLVIGVNAVVPVQAVSLATPPKNEFINRDGTLKLDGNYSGSIDLQGWNVQLDPVLGPVFRPAQPLASQGWSALGSGFSGDGALSNEVWAIAVNGSDVYVGGFFTDVMNKGVMISEADFIAKWDGTDWSALGSNGAGNGSLNQFVTSIVIVGSDIYVGGAFANVNNHGTVLPAADYIAKWNGTDWSALGSNGAGNGSLNGSITAMAVKDNNLYVGGVFTNVNNYGNTLFAADYIAKWDGANWSALGSNGANDGSLNFVPRAITSSGSNLYVGGEFTDVNNNGTILTAADYIVKWDGANWSALGSNGAGNGSVNNTVYDIAVSGSNVYAGGIFLDVNNSGTILNTADWVAKWDGLNWSALGSNFEGNGALSGSVLALAVQGNDLYVGGYFSNAANGVEYVDTAKYVARWDGTRWSALGSNGAGRGSLNGSVWALTLNQKLYVGGQFTDVNNEGTILNNADHIAVYEYPPANYTLTITSAHGTVTKNPDKVSYSAGETVQLTATADHGWLFEKWAGDVIDTANPISVTMNGNKSVTANFIRSGADTTGVFRPSNGLLYLKNKNDTGFADAALNYGLPGDYPVVGDWDGDGTVTIGIYRSGYFYLKNSNTLGFAEVVFPFGTPGDQPIAGDWNGDGVDTIGVFHPSNGHFLLRNSNTEGPSEMDFYLGNPGDVGIAGDWDGDGKDSTGVFRPSNGVIFLKDTNDTGFADYALNYGLPGDQPVMGDWDNDGKDTIGIYRNGSFYLRNSNANGFAEIIFGLGNPGDMPIAGNWDGLP